MIRLRDRLDVKSSRGLPCTGSDSSIFSEPWKIFCISLSFSSYKYSVLTLQATTLALSTS